MNNFSKLENIFLEEERKVSCNTSHPTVGRIEITAINSNGWGTYKMYEGFSTFIGIGSRSISSLINSYKQRIIQIRLLLLKPLILLSLLVGRLIVPRSKLKILQ